MQTIQGYADIAQRAISRDIGNHVLSRRYNLMKRCNRCLATTSTSLMEAGHGLWLELPCSECGSVDALLASIPDSRAQLPFSLESQSAMNTADIGWLRESIQLLSRMFRVIIVVAFEAYLHCFGKTIG